MVVAIDHCTAKLCTHLVKLVTEVRHLVRTVLISCDDLIDRVNDDGNIVLFCSPPDQFWCQLIHRDRLTSQIPDIDVLQVLWLFYTHSCIHIFETVQTACPVKFQVDIQHFSLCTVPFQPLLPLCNRHAQLNL